MGEKLIIGIDIGYGEVKAVASDQRMVRFPTMATPVEGALARRGISHGVAAGLLDDGRRKWVVGEHAIEYSSSPMVAHVDSSWIESDLFRVSCMSCLERLGTRSARVVLGLPIVNCKVSQVRRLKEVVKSWGSLGYPVDVLDIVPQPVGTVLDLSYDNETNRITTYDEAHIGVIDIGTGTVDSVDVYRLNVRYGDQHYRSEAGGMVRAYEALRMQIDRRYNYAPDMAMLPQLLKCRSITLGGKQVDIGGMVQRALDPVVSVAERHYRELWGSGVALSALVLTGGGAYAVRPLLIGRLKSKRNWTDDLVMPNDPSMANARGFLKHGLLKVNARA